MASYTWTSLFTRYSELTPANKETILNNFIGQSHQIATWKNAIELRSLIALVHEIVHFYQDILTGIGHSDYLTLRTFFPKASMWAKELHKIDGNNVPFAKDREIYRYHDYYKYCLDSYFKEVEKCKSYLHMPVLGKTKNEYFRNKQIIKTIESLLSEDLKNYTYEEFSLEYLLEAEAVCTVYLYIDSLKMSEKQNEILLKNEALYRPDKMTIPYNKTISSVLVSLKKYLSNSEIESDTILKLTFRLIIMLVDWSCAYPDTSFIQKSNINPLDFDPSIKFVRLFKAFFNLSEESIERFKEYYEKGEARNVEKILIDNCGVAYPQSLEIYESWQELFDRKLIENDNLIYQMRRNSCENRVNSQLPLYGKSIHNLFYDNSNIPINIVVDNKGVTTASMNEQAWDMQFKINLLDDLAAWNRDINLHNYFYKNGYFKCPLGEFDICQARIDSCLKMKSLDLMPYDSRCLMRSSMVSFF